jgi:hypothetical protein
MGQPTNRSALLVLPALALPTPYPPAHTFYTTSTSLVDEFLIEIHPIRQDHVSKGALVFVVAVCLERDRFPKE